MEGCTLQPLLVCQNRTVSLSMIWMLCLYLLQNQNGEEGMKAEACADYLCLWCSLLSRELTSALRSAAS